MSQFLAQSQSASMLSSYLDISFQQFRGSTNRVLAFATIHEEPFPLRVNL